VWRQDLAGLTHELHARHHQRLRDLAATGVDRISIGGLTKDVKATDFSMRFEDWA